MNVSKHTLSKLKDNVVEKYNNIEKQNGGNK